MTDAELLLQLAQLAQAGRIATPRALLDELARVGAALAKAGRARPEVELQLAGGAAVRGRIVSVADDRGGAVALVHVGGSAVSFARLEQTVADASLLVKAPSIDAPVPSRLELQRQVAARADALRMRLELAGALDDADRRAIGAALSVIADVLAGVAADDMGREALRGIDVVELGAADGVEVQRVERRLAIRAPRLLTEPLTAAALRREVEKQL